MHLNVDMIIAKSSSKPRGFFGYGPVGQEELSFFWSMPICLCSQNPKDYLAAV